MFIVDAHLDLAYNALQKQRDPRRKFGVEAVYSDEPLRAPGESAACDERPAGSGLNCAGYGSSVCVTAPFGLFAAGVVLRRLTQSPD